MNFAYLGVVFFQLYAYNLLASINLYLSIALLLIVGGLVNGPYALITTAVSAELGTHDCLKGNAKALATVTSIIDGTGSIGKKIEKCLPLCGFSIRFFIVIVFLIRSGRRTVGSGLHVRRVRVDKRLLHVDGFQRARHTGKRPRIVVFQSSTDNCIVWCGFFFEFVLLVPKDRSERS